VSLIGKNMYNSKQIPVLRYTFIGAKQYFANRALEICVERHSSLRADNVTPYYLHPVAVTSYLLTLSPNFMYVEETLVAALLHDTVEDTDIGIRELHEMLLFGVPKNRKFDVDATMTAISYLSKNLHNPKIYSEQILLLV
jgi:(p)ppGpp synthase/HD superfamily hydrolase